MIQNAKICPAISKLMPMAQLENFTLDRWCPVIGLGQLNWHISYSQFRSYMLAFLLQ